MLTGSGPEIGRCSLALVLRSAVGSLALVLRSAVVTGSGPEIGGAHWLWS